MSRELEWGDNDFEDNGNSGGEEDATEEEPNMEETTQASPNESMPSPNIPVAAQGRPRRENRRAPEWQKDYVSGSGLSLSDEDEEASSLVLYATLDPITFEEAAGSEKWLEAMKLEIQAIEKNETWELVELPAGAKKIGVKWVFKTKLNELGEVDKHKARLVAKGYAQKHGVDYNEVFAPVAKWDTIRMVIAMAAQKGWGIC